eukprot:5515630-Prymnesium_polylepis.1
MAPRRERGAVGVDLELSIGPVARAGDGDHARDRADVRVSIQQQLTLEVDAWREKPLDAILLEHNPTALVVAQEGERALADGLLREVAGADGRGHCVVGGLRYASSETSVRVLE